MTETMSVPPAGVAGGLTTKTILGILASIAVLFIVLPTPSGMTP